MEPTTIIPIKFDTVLIYDREYDLYDIPGKEHEGFNDVPKSWWIYLADRLPNNMIPPADSPHFKPYNVSINRRLWEIIIKQSITTKEKYDELRFNNHTKTEMYCNGKLVYAFSSIGTPGGLSFSMAKVQYLQTILSEHTYDFFHPEKNNDRKIFWYGLPATIRVHKACTWEISIIPDYTEGLDKEQWWAELANRQSKISKKDQKDEFDEIENEDTAEYKQNDSINWGDALSDDNIDWFRK